MPIACLEGLCFNETSMSTSHLIIVLVILLLVFGPSRIEGIGSSLGKAVKGFKKGIEEGAGSTNTTQVTKKEETPNSTTVTGDKPV